MGFVYLKTINGNLTKIITENLVKKFHTEKPMYISICAFPMPI